MAHRKNTRRAHRRANRKNTRRAAHGGRRNMTRKNRGPVGYITSPIVTLGEGAAGMIGNVARAGANVLQTAVRGVGKAVKRGSSAVNRSGRQLLGRSRRNTRRRRNARRN